MKGNIIKERNDTVSSRDYGIQHSRRCSKPCRTPRQHQEHQYTHAIAIAINYGTASLFPSVSGLAMRSTALFHLATILVQ